MITAVFQVVGQSDGEGLRGDACPREEDFRSLRVSTREYRCRAGASEAARITKWAFKAARPTLWEELRRLPCNKDFLRWGDYVAAALPILDERIRAMQLRCVRRARFTSYMKRDKTLDSICHRLCGAEIRSSDKSIVASDRPVLVAFGAANACSTGFGYAPAPQSRLRRRLENIHGARVSLIDEFRTSRACSACSSTLDAVYSRGRKIHGVLKCPVCRSSPDMAPLHWHRDVNAARNIRAAYLSLARDGTRPQALSRSQKRDGRELAGFCEGSKSSQGPLLLVATAAKVTRCRAV